MDIQNNTIQYSGITGFDGGGGLMSMAGKLGKGNMGKFGQKHIGKVGKIGLSAGKMGIGLFWGKTQVKIFLVAAVLSYIVSVAYGMYKKAKFSIGGGICTSITISCCFCVVGALAMIGGLPVPGPQVKGALALSWIIALIPLCCISSTLAS